MDSRERIRFTRRGRSSDTPRVPTDARSRVPTGARPRVPPDYCSRSLSRPRTQPCNWMCANCHYINNESRRNCRNCSAFKSGGNIKSYEGWQNYRGTGHFVYDSRGRYTTQQGNFASVEKVASAEYKESSRGNQVKHSSSHNTHKGKRKYPIGHDALEKLLEQYPEQVIMQLLLEKSGYDLLLENPEEQKEDKICLLMKVLAHATKTRSNKESLNMLITKTFKPKFTNWLLSFSLSLLMNKVDIKIKLMYFENMVIILDKYAHAMSNSAMDNIFVIIEGCLVYMKQKSDNQMKNVILKFTDIKSFLEDEKAKWQSRSKGRSQNSRRWQDDLYPPESFRELPILPTVHELNDPGRPFLRRNIVEGKYDDIDHYLDIQFRLLREDFVRPLRNGIQAFRGKAPISDLFIYKNVRIVSVDVKNHQMVHNVRLNLPKNFKADSSKRLLYGNLVCLTSDNFCNIILGSISERNPKMLRQGILGVTFDSDVRISANQTYSIAESRSYFTAYKHVLKALQGITKDSFPMEKFIVDVESDMQLPDYLNDGDRVEYDLRVVLDKRMMKESEVYNNLFRPKGLKNLINVHAPALKRVSIAKDLEFWPSCAELKLDESQRHALQSALTSKLAIIQGPPGTGKTFLGLKIAQVLLHNSQCWNKKETACPILVVCYTNHALDQFLEGVYSFTQSIVRIGSRTNSDIIEQFQINNLVRHLRADRVIPGEIHQNLKFLGNKLSESEERVKPWWALAFELKQPSGILQFRYLVKNNVIPENVVQQFQRSNQDLNSFLLDPRFIYTIDKASSSYKKQENHRKHEEDEEFWHDAEDYFAEEEDARRIDDDQEYLPSGSGISENILQFSVKLKDVEARLYDLIQQKQNVNSEPMQIMEIDREIWELEVKYKLLKFGLSIPFDSDEMERIRTTDIMSLDIVDRWLLYKYWLNKVAENFAPKVKKIEDEFSQCLNAFNEVKDQQYLHVMRQASVVGMTTTGAAKYSNVLQGLRPTIVIIEEAAEILEAHVVTALTKECQHLILIGDHQQLQPSPTVYELATKFGLETSLFERLIKNKIWYETLQYQHRMRPGISRLLVPSIYPDLKDHESVHRHPHIKGMQKDIFFIDHTYQEKKGENDNTSKENDHEAILIMTLCRHLMLQGYSPKDITVLTPYSGQLFLLKKIRRRYDECQDIRISIVDNFQGDESNIILLSLVRSNEKGVVGFLRKENRVCVALSRAKHGLYITGNMTQLRESSDLWQNIFSQLLNDESIDSSITFQCENHPDVLTSVSTAEDILSKSPEGGCLKPCSSSLPICGHKCPKACHMTDPKHTSVKCPIPCPEILCERYHPCPLKCWEECKPCTVDVEKTLPCGHKHEVQCSKYNSQHKCPTNVKRYLPDCQHEATMQCHNDPALFPCPTPCDIRLPCGHQCMQNCHVKKDPNHYEYKCEQPCTKSKEGCSQNHKCEKSCYEVCDPCKEPDKKKAPCGHRLDVLCSTREEDMICDQKCKRSLPCGHHCNRMCKEKCGGCTVRVDKIIDECSHVIKVECSEIPKKSDCSNVCVLKLSCGHPCKERCMDPCTTKCEVRVLSNKICPKEHQIQVPCFLRDTISEEDAACFCMEPCGAQLDCNHGCKGSCGQCFQGRLHIACGEKCERTLVCGHICKEACSSVCPPCQASCPLNCGHNRCVKKCGEPCTPCKAKCLRKCRHQKCDNICSEKCTIRLCEKPCPEKLTCGHPCVGYCGDPCPPLCRICNKDELTQILFGSEDEEDARFVLLEDCGHTIEAEGLKGWLQQDTGEIGMKMCPLCKKPVYKNERNWESVQKVYKDVISIQNQYYTKKPKAVAHEINKLFAEMESLSGKEVDVIKAKLPQTSTLSAEQIHLTVSDGEINLYNFQVRILKGINALLKDNLDWANSLTNPTDLLKSRLMEQKIRIAPQMADEITCELQRLSILPAYWKVIKRVLLLSNSISILTIIKNRLKILMNPTVKFDSEKEKNVRQLLNESQNYVGQLGISDKERIDILRAMSLKQGHWYKCPNGHIYCITECGGATEETYCPDCGAKIGGSSHTLRSDNAVATEMDGAQHAAWSDHYNNMGNFNFDD